MPDGEPGHGRRQAIFLEKWVSFDFLPPAVLGRRAAGAGGGWRGGEQGLPGAAPSESETRRDGLVGSSGLRSPGNYIPSFSPPRSEQKGKLACVI